MALQGLWVQGWAWPGLADGEVMTVVGVASGPGLPALGSIHLACWQADSRAVGRSDGRVGGCLQAWSLITPPKEHAKGVQRDSRPSPAPAGISGFQAQIPFAHSRPCCLQLSGILPHPEF